MYTSSSFDSGSWKATYIITLISNWTEAFLVGYKRIQLEDTINHDEVREVKVIHTSWT